MKMLLIVLVESMHMVMIHLILSSNEDCSFIGFYCSGFSVTDSAMERLH